VRGIAIYVEGGGDSADQKRDLRNGLDGLFRAQKQAAQTKRLRWRLVPSGGRTQTFDAFVNELRLGDSETLCILLVDSEEGLSAEPRYNPGAKAQSRKRHLEQRDGWDLSGVAAEQIHLMVRCMEAWIVADSEALASWYGQGFHANRLPQRQNLEEEPKRDLFDKLGRATGETQKGTYEKIGHASKLLAIVSPEKVAVRCPCYKEFTEWLSAQIEDA